MYKIGVVGLGVMGANLARNIASKGFPVAGLRPRRGQDAGVCGGAVERTGIGSADAPERLMAVLERPRRVLMMVPAGAPVDSVIAHLRPHLEREDILIDGGNSFFRDTDRRADDLASAGFRFVGMGVSGGEEGALRGPSMMPGGPREAWDALAPILRAMAAKAEDGEPCVSYMGPRGAGHYVKMVHNGIEYGDMQLIAEVYDVLTRAAGMTAREIADLFAKWNEGELRVVPRRDHGARARARRRRNRQAARRSHPRRSAAEGHRQMDEPERVRRRRSHSDRECRCGGAIALGAEIRARRRQQVLSGSASSVESPAQSDRDFSRADLVDATRRALYAAKITSYAQGMALLRQASHEYKYGIDLAEVAKIWRAGCIIRAALLSDVRAAFDRNPALVNLMLDDSFSKALASGQQALRDVVQAAVTAGIPVPALGSSLALLRLVSQRAPSGQSDAGAARFLWRTHLSPRRSRRRLPHRLDTGMSNPLEIPAKGDLDFLSLGALVHRLDSGIYPFHKASSVQIHVSGGEFNTSANLSDCFGLRTAVASAMVDYPVGDLINERVQAMGVRPFYKRFAHDGARGPNMATVYSDRGQGVRAPVVFYNRSNEAAALLKPGDFDWKAIFAGGVRWFHSGGIFAALSETTAELIVEAMQAAKNSGAIVSFDLNYREKLWNASGGGHKRALEVMSRIVKHVDVLVGNEEDLQKGLGIPGPEVAAKSGLDSGAFLAMIDNVVSRHPQIKVLATTLREVHSTNRHTWSAVAWMGEGVRRSDLRARCARSCRRRRRIRLGSVLRPHERRITGRGAEARMGAWRAHHDVSR